MVTHGELTSYEQLGASWYEAVRVNHAGRHTPSSVMNTKGMDRLKQSKRS